MANEQTIIQDLLALPLEERAKVFEKAPQMRNTIENFLSQTSDFAGLPNAEKVAVRINLGLPSLTEVGSPDKARYANIMRQATPLFTGETEKRHAKELEQYFSGHPFKAAASFIAKTYVDYYRDFFAPIREGLTPKTSMLELPFGINIDVGTESKMGAISRGFVSAVPGMSSARPQLPQADFFSIENAARIATDIVLTAPFLTAKVVAGAVPVAQSFYQSLPLIKRFFIQYPTLARAAANATIQGGVIAAYEAMSKELSKLISTGKIPTVYDLAKSTSQEFLAVVPFLAGLHGLIGVGKGIKPAITPLSAEQFSEAVGAGTKEGLRNLRFPARGAKIRSAAEVIGEVPATLITKEVTSPLTLGGRPRIEPGKPPVIEPQFKPLTPPEPIPPLQPGEINLIPESPTSLTLRRAQETIAPGLAETQAVTSAAERAIASPVPGFMRSAEDLLYKKAAARVDNVLGPTDSVVHPTGIIEASIPEPALRTGFVASEDAIIGDLVYANGKVAKVVDRLENGLQVASGTARYFVPFEKVTGKTKFAIGEEVVKDSGEVVIVDSVLPGGNIRVVDKRGAKYAVSPERITTQAEYATQAETVERASQGIDLPAPEGNTIWGILKKLPSEETGAILPAGHSPSRKAAKKTVPSSIPIYVTTQPDPTNFGGFRAFMDPPVVLALKNKPQYDIAAKLVYDAKTVEAVTAHANKELLINSRKMVGVGTATSEKLTRALIGLPFKSDSYTNAEKAVLTNVRQWIQKEIVPSVNDRRAIVGLPPVPNDYNAVFDLIPEMIFTAGSRAQGLAGMFGKLVKPTGVENFVQTPFGSGVRLEIKANFWEVLQELGNLVTQEKAWKTPSNYIRILSSNESSPSAKSYLNWYARHLEGKPVSPSISEISATSSWIDNQLVARGFSKHTATFKDSTGKPVTLEIPRVSLSDKSLNDFVRSSKTLNYAAMIGYNLRTILLNVTQPITNGMAQLPERAIAATFDTLLGYTKAGATLVKGLFTEDALKYYRELGVLHDMEEIFTPVSITKTGDYKSALYASQWLWHKAISGSFLGMRAAEMINRITVFEAHQAAIQRTAKRLSPQSIQDPEFQAALVRASTYAASIANFLYGKGFRSPLQEGYIPLPKNLSFNIGPLGDVIMQFNTFGIKHMQTIALLLRQNPKFGDHINFAHRMAAIGAPKEFGQFIKALHPVERLAFFRALVYQYASASLIGGGLGLASISYQLDPRGLIGLNPATPLLKSFGAMLTDLFQMDLAGITNNLRRNYIPGVNAARRMFGPGRTTLTERTLSTRTDIEGKRPIGAPPTIGEQYESLFGPSQPGGTRGY